jgi:uncharacterized protein YgbK (DUF1537 family)
MTSRLLDAMRSEHAFYVQTNSRALDRAAAVTLVTDIGHAALSAASVLGLAAPRFVLRGDSTLRGHVFAESDAFATDDSVMLFQPAFPAGGRTTENGVHYVQVDGRRVPAGDTEYALDPVFGFHSSRLVDYVREQGGSRPVVGVPIEALRSSDGNAIAAALLTTSPGTVIAPDAVTDDDIRLIQRGLDKAWAAGRNVVVRCAAPLAAMCADVYANSLLSLPLPRPDGPVLVVCGSHTTGATSQLRSLRERFGINVALLDTRAALTDPDAAGTQLADCVRKDLRQRGVAAIATERDRRAGDNTLNHGERVMAALTTAVRHLRTDVAAVVAKGGITSAEVAHTGLVADTARVRGQLLAGVSLWELHADVGTVVYVVVPGNVGTADALVDVLRGLNVMPPHLAHT